MKTVLAVITKDKKVLVGKLFQEKAKEWGVEYVFPGGKIEEEETSENAVRREVLEETGLQIIVKSKIGERVHPKTAKLIEYFHCVYESGSESTESAENDDIESLKWVGLEELDDYMPTLFDKVREYLFKITSPI